MRRLQAHERKNDVRQGEERERDTGQFAEHTVLRDAIRGDSLGLLLHLLKACESLINRGSSHFRYLPFQIVERCGARPMPMTEVFVLFNYFRSVQSLSFAFRKKAAFCRENSAICTQQPPDCMQSGASKAARCAIDTGCRGHPCRRKFETHVGFKCNHVSSPLTDAPASR